MSDYFAHRPDPSEYAPYYAQYISLVPDGNLLDTLTTQHEQIQYLRKNCRQLSANVPRIQRGGLRGMRK